MLIRLEGNSYAVSRRLWAFAGYFRFARPGSVRIGAKSSAENVYVSAFENVNGTVAIPVINERHFEQEVAIILEGVRLQKGIATAYVADNERNNSRADQYGAKRSSFRASLRPRSLTTFFLE